MTVIIGHKSDSGVFLFSDSALTHHGPLMSSPLSTFGELQDVDGRRVEELMPKVIELPRQVLSAFSGDVGSALSFLQGVAQRLKYTNGAVDNIAKARLDVEAEDPHFHRCSPLNSVVAPRPTGPSAVAASRAARAPP